MLVLAGAGGGGSDGETTGRRWEFGREAQAQAASGQAECKERERHEVREVRRFIKKTRENLERPAGPVHFRSKAGRRPGRATGPPFYPF